MYMTTSFKSAAKRLTFSLMALSALGGCAVYGPAPVGPYYGTNAYGQATYAAPPVYAAPYYSPYYTPQYAPYYGPTYIGPPLSLNFGFGLRGGGHRGSYRGHGGYRGGHR